jgi:hypothetical protein
MTMLVTAGASRINPNPGLSPQWGTAAPGDLSIENLSKRCFRILGVSPKLLIVSLEYCMMKLPASTPFNGE